MKAILEWRGIKVEYMEAKEADPAADTVALAHRRLLRANTSR